MLFLIIILFPELKISNFILTIYIVSILLEYFLDCYHNAWILKLKELSAFSTTLTLSFQHPQLFIFRSKIKKKTDFIIIFLLQFSFTNSWDQLLWVMHFKRYLHNIEEAATRGVLRKKVFLEISQKFTGKHLCQSPFLIKMQDYCLQVYLQRDSGTGVFLWILQNF